jgi:hypothetical protein
MNDAQDNAAAWKDTEARIDGDDHPAGEMRLTKRKMFGARLSVLSGMGVVAIAGVTPFITPTLVSFHLGPPPA